MWQVKQAEKLKCEIETLLAPLSGVIGLYGLVKETLTQARRGLVAEGALDRPWSLLPLMVCEAICGDYEHALPAAVALQFLMAAGDVFDDIEDADSSASLPARYGTALATNAGTTLLILAEKAIVGLKARGATDCTIVRIMDAVNSHYITACAGQHLDLSLASELVVSEDSYLRIIGMKSASQVECACHIGALLATANQELVDTFTVFGHNLGMAAQITNDIHGIIHGNDILRQKITLPVIYALAQTDGEARNQLETTFGKASESVLDPTQIRDLLFHTGAVHYATIKMEHYKQRARDSLSKAEEAGANTQRLKLFLE